MREIDVISKLTSPDQTFLYNITLIHHRRVGKINTALITVKNYSTWDGSGGNRILPSLKSVQRHEILWIVILSRVKLLPIIFAKSPRSWWPILRFKSLKCLFFFFLLSSLCVVMVFRTRLNSKLFFFSGSCITVFSPRFSSRSFLNERTDSLRGRRRDWI